MKKRLNLKVWACATVALGVLTPLAARCQAPGTFDYMPPQSGGDTNRPPLLQIQAETSYTGSGNATFRGAKAPSSDAWNGSLSLFMPIPVSPEWVVPIGFSSQNIELQTTSWAPVPERINTVSFNAGLGHRIGDRWMVMAMVNPTLYRLTDVGGSAIGVSGGVNALWRYDASLSFRFGLMVSPDSDLKLLPMVGADWWLDDRWNLRLMFPQPRLVYRLNDRWNAYVGGNMVSSTFRTSQGLGTAIGLARYNNALGTYRDVRLGVGVHYNWSRAIGAELETGYSVSRQMDYTRIGERVKFDPAPYVRFSVNLGF